MITRLNLFIKKNIFYLLFFYFKILHISISVFDFFYHYCKYLNYLQLAFIKALILQHFDLKSHIQIKTNALSYAIDGVLSQLNLDSNALSNNSNLNKSDFG